MRDGVKLQLSGERDFALWSDRRDAYVEFLSSLEAVSAGIVHAQALASTHIEGLANASTGDIGVAREEINGQVKTLLLSRSKMRMSVGNGEFQEAGVLVTKTQLVVSRLDRWVDAALAHAAGDEVHWASLLEGIRELRDAIDAWAIAAQHQLRASGDVVGTP